MGICVSLIADVHHLTSRGINPHFPSLLDSRFGNALQFLTKPERHELMNAINGLMKSAYMELLLGDYSGDTEFSNFEASIEQQFELLDSSSASGIIDKLDSATEEHVGKEERICANDEIQSKTIPEIIDIINERCASLNINKQSLSDKIVSLRDVDPSFVSMIEELCEQQLVTLEEIAK